MNARGHAAPGLALEAAGNLEACRAQLEDNRRDARALVEGRTTVQLLWRPRPNAWSVAECLLHLTTSARSYLGAIDRAITLGRRRGFLAEGPYHHPWFSRWFVDSMEPPPKRKFSAPRMFLPPPPPEDARAALDDFEAVGLEIGERLDAAAGLDLGRVRVVSPATPLVRLSLGMAFALLPAHERRHLYQARAVVAAPDFPSP